MGRQGGIARFTGSVCDINCYFDYGMEIARTKSQLSKETWEKSPSFRDQRRCATVFGASAVIAARIWKGLPVGMRRLGDASAYGRFVGAVRMLTQEDGQLWDADLLKRLDLSTDSVGPHFVAAGGQGLGARGEIGLGASEGLGADGGALRGVNSYQLKGIDALMGDLDVALGGAAGTMASTYVIAHPFWGDGFVHEEPMSEWRGGDTTYSEKANRIRKPLGWKRGKKDKVQLPKIGGIWGAKHDGSGKLCGPLPIPEGFKRPQRRVRVWVHACEVVDTQWNARDKRFVVADGQRQFSNGFVTEWLVVDGDAFGSYDIAGRDWRTEWMGDGTYVVFTAIEVQEKRGRHWVRLPWCCRFGVQEVVVIENEEFRIENGVCGSSVGVKQEAGVRRHFGKVGYLNEQGQIVVVEDLALVGEDRLVYPIESLLPLGKLLGRSETDEQDLEVTGLGARQKGLKTRYQVQQECSEDIGQGTELSDGECNGLILIEFKSNCAPSLDRKQEKLTCENSSLLSPFARSLFSKAFAMAEGIASANSGLWPPFARSLFSKEFAMAEAVRAGP